MNGDCQTCDHCGAALMEAQPDGSLFCKYMTVTEAGAFCSDVCEAKGPKQEGSDAR